MKRVLRNVNSAIWIVRIFNKDITMKKKYILSWLVVFLGAMSGLVSSDTADGQLFEVNGMQLVIAPPEGWDAVWMDGDPDGQYFIEYLPKGDDVNSWRDGYIFVQRTSLVSQQDFLNKIESAGYSLLDFMFKSFTYKAQQTCPGNFIKSKPKAEFFNGIKYILGAGYCDKYGPAAPYGESNVFAYAQHGELIFNIKFAWRPRSKQDQIDNPHWPISQEKVDFTFNVLKGAFLCGDEGYEECSSLVGNN